MPSAFAIALDDVLIGHGEPLSEASRAGGSKHKAREPKATPRKSPHVGRHKGEAGGRKPRETAPAAQPQSAETNQRVAALQRRLSSLGHELADDGSFGPKTDAAVREFQRAANITSDGAVGPVTSEALRSAPSPEDMLRADVETEHIGVGQGDMSEPDADAETAEKAGSRSPAGAKPQKISGTRAETSRTGPPVLTKGAGVGTARDAGAVKELQDDLGHAGIPLDVDGAFGPETDKGVKRFQRKYGLKVDGIVGPQTRRALGMATKNSKDEMQEALMLNEAFGFGGLKTFDPEKHARDRVGKFAAMIGAHGNVGLPDGTRVARAGSGFTVTASRPESAARSVPARTRERNAMYDVGEREGKPLPPHSDRMAASTSASTPEEAAAAALRYSRYPNPTDEETGTGAKRPAAAARRRSALAENKQGTSMAKASSPEPFSTSKTSNWVARAGGLPPYIQHIAHDLVEKRGKTVSQAIRMAIGIVKNWAHGHGGVTADTKAAAAKALVQWSKMKASNAAKKVAGALKESDFERMAAWDGPPLQLAEGEERALERTLLQLDESILAYPNGMLVEAVVREMGQLDQIDHALAVMEADGAIGETTCPKGHPIPVGETECETCKQLATPNAYDPLKELGEASISEKTCVKGHPVPVGKKKCPTCGTTKFHRKSRNVLPGYDTAMAEADTRADFSGLGEAAHKLKCPKCDHVQSAANKSCSSCGHDLSEARKAKFAKLNEALHAAAEDRALLEAFNFTSAERSRIAKMLAQHRMRDRNGRWAHDLHPHMHEAMGAAQREVDEGKGFMFGNSGGYSAEFGGHHQAHITVQHRQVGRRDTPVYKVVGGHPGFDPFGTYGDPPEGQEYTSHAEAGAAFLREVGKQRKAAAADPNVKEGEALHPAEPFKYEGKYQANLMMPDGTFHGSRYGGTGDAFKGHSSFSTEAAAKEASRALYKARDRDRQARLRGGGARGAGGPMNSHDEMKAFGKRFDHERKAREMNESMLAMALPLAGPGSMAAAGVGLHMLTKRHRLDEDPRDQFHVGQHLRYAGLEGQTHEGHVVGFDRMSDEPVVRHADGLERMVARSDITHVKHPSGWAAWRARHPNRGR